MQYKELDMISVLLYCLYADPLYTDWLQWYFEYIFISILMIFYIVLIFIVETHAAAATAASDSDWDSDDLEPLKRKWTLMVNR